MSGCGAELFLKRAVRMEGLATIPHHLKEVGIERRRRSESRERANSRSRRRRKEVFKKGDRVTTKQ